MTNFTFEDTLTQIGLGYPIAFLLAFARPAGSGRPWAPSWLVIGQRGLSIRRRAHISTTPLSVFLQTGTQLHWIPLALEQEQQPGSGV